MLLLLVTILILLFTYHFWSKRNLPPGPWGLPIIGYLPWLDPISPYLTLMQLSKKYGEIYGLSLGNVYTVVLTDPKTIKEAFSKEATTGRAPLYLTHGIMKGYGLICAEGELWKDQRKFVSKCLKQLGASKIGHQRNKMEMLIKKHLTDFLEFVAESCLDMPVNPLEPLRHTLGSIINEVVFGKSWSREDETWKWLQHLQEEGTKLIGVAGPLNFLPFLRFLPNFKRSMQFLLDGKMKTHKLYQKIIEEQKQGLKSDITADNIIEAFLLERVRKSDDVVKAFYNDQQFYHLLADVFGASLDTTLTTLRWYLLFLAKYPRIQETIHAELEEVLQGRSLSIDDRPQLRVLEASILETQRIRSVVPVGIPHGSTDELTIKGYTIPKGTMIVPLQWALHMNEDVWDKPEEFNPNRFINEEGNVTKNEYFMPFQVGKRMCVGDELAMMLLYLFCGTIIKNFQIALEDDADVDLGGDCGITLTPKDYKLIFRKV